MARKKKNVEPDADGVLRTGIYQRDCRPRRKMKPREFMDVMKAQILDPPTRPTIHQWLGQHLEFFASILRPHVKPATPNGPGRLLNMGDGWQGYQLADDLDEVCRDAVEGVDAIRLLEHHVDASGKLAADGVSLPIVMQQTYNLGRIVERIQVRPFEPLVLIGERQRELPSKGGKATAAKHGKRTPKIEKRARELFAQFFVGKASKDAAYTRTIAALDKENITIGRTTLQTILKSPTA